MITEQMTKDEMKTFPSEVLITLYSVALFHEKYRFAKWIMEILLQRNVKKEHMSDFNENFKGFYENLLNQEDL